MNGIKLKYQIYYMSGGCHLRKSLKVKHGQPISLTALPAMITKVVDDNAILFSDIIIEVVASNG